MNQPPFSSNVSQFRAKLTHHNFPKMTSHTQEGVLQQRLSTLTMVAMAFAILKLVYLFPIARPSTNPAVRGLHSLALWRIFFPLAVLFRLSMASWFVSFAIWLLLLVWENLLLCGLLLV
jgi:hypothetical protein